MPFGQTHKSRFRLLLAVITSWTTLAWALDDINLQLKWHHQFQFAGYYAAKELGYYSREGLNVAISPVLKDINPIDTVVSGKAQYGVGSNDLLLVRNSGSPVVVLAVIIQHSPYVLITTDKSGIQSIQDVVGKRVMFDPYATEIMAFLRKADVPLSKIIQINKNDYLPEDLISGIADAYAGYSTNDPFYFEKRGIRYSLFSPRSEGIDFYGDNLFTTEDEIKKHPQRVKAFLKASLEGWNYALNNPEKTVDLMISKGYGKSEEREKLLFEAKKLAQLIHADLIPVGYMNRERWRHIADTYAELGMLPKNFPLASFLYEEEKSLPSSAKFALAALLLISLAATAAAVRNYVVRRKLFIRLFQSNSRFEKVVNSVSGAVFQYRLQPDGKATFPYYTPVLKDLFPVVPDGAPLPPDQIFRTVHEQDKERFFESLEKSKTELTPWQVECQVDSLRGQTVWIYVNAIPEKDKNGLITWHGVITDITEKKTAEFALIKNVAELKAVERRLLDSRLKLREMTAKREVAREEERRRVAYEIHDELGQLMSVLRMNVMMLDYRYGESLPELHQQVERSVTIVDRAIRVIRELTTRLRPTVLDTGIGTSLEWIVSEFSESTGLECRLTLSGQPVQLNEETSIVIFRIVQESLSNALRHANATLVEISLECHDRLLLVTITDNGRGFDPGIEQRHNAYGILGMQERALSLGGNLEIQSEPGKGTRLRLSIPIFDDAPLPGI